MLVRHIQPIAYHPARQALHRFSMHLPQISDQLLTFNAEPAGQFCIERHDVGWAQMNLDYETAFSITVSLALSQRGSDHIYESKVAETDLDMKKVHGALLPRTVAYHLKPRSNYPC